MASVSQDILDERVLIKLHIETCTMTSGVFFFLLLSFIIIIITIMFTPADIGAFEH